MLAGKTVAVVIPCYKEQKQVGKVLDTIPDFVDYAIVVDDCSPDQTAEVVRARSEESRGGTRVVLLCHEANKGVGAAIVTGYREALRREIDVTAVMAGDGQMAPEELHLLVGLIAKGEADYAKGNRLFYRNAWASIPKHRYLGNAFLSMLTKIASGYWHVADSQSGYTAISRTALELIDLDAIYERYGYPNDMLVRLNVYEMRVADVPVRPVYGVGEKSKMKLVHVMPRMSWLLLRMFCFRLKERYMVHDFHPLLLFFIVGAGLLGIGLLFGIYLMAYRLIEGPVAGTSGLFSALLIISGLQLLLFAMWLDMENNRHLRVDVRRMWWSGVRSANGNGGRVALATAAITPIEGATVVAEANGHSAASPSVEPVERLEASSSSTTS